MYAAKNLHLKTTRNLALHLDNPKEGIRKAFEETNAWILNQNFKSGSTAVICYIKDQHLFCANIGDSHCLLGCTGKNYYKLTTDHKPSVPSEKERIEGLGGKVYKKLGISRVNGILTVSRAFGDIDLYPYVSSEPSIQVLEIEEEHNFLLLASDGLWDAISSKQAIEIVFEKAKTESNVAEYLANMAYSLGSQDNISVVVVFLKSIDEWDA